MICPRLCIVVCLRIPRHFVSIASSDTHTQPLVVDFLFLFNITTTYLITQHYRHPSIARNGMRRGIGSPNAVNRSPNGLRGTHKFRHLLNLLTHSLISLGRMGSVMVSLGLDRVGDLADIQPSTRSRGYPFRPYVISRARKRR